MMSSDMSTGEEDSKKEQKMKKTKKKDEDRLSEGRKATPHPDRGLMWSVRTVFSLRWQRRRSCLQDGVGAMEGVSAVLHQFVSGQMALKQRSDWLISDMPHLHAYSHSSLCAGVCPPVQFGAKCPLVSFCSQRSLPNLQA